jgi:hypothetical protein
LSVRFGRLIFDAAAVALLSIGCAVLPAQVIGDRVTKEIDSRSSVALPGTLNPRAAAQYDTGTVDAGTRLKGITMYFKPSAEQQAELNGLVHAQETRGSAYYHKWLTPAAYANRFGLSDSDLAKIERWLEAQGFTVDRVNNSHTGISFSGTVAQVESAFRTEIHSFEIDGKKHIANATRISVPSALSGVLQSLRNLDDFRPKPQVRFRPAQSSKISPNFTSSQSGDHFLTPKDVATIYDINAAYDASYTGTGQSIAVVGQSEIEISDIENFQSAAGLTVKDPTLVLVPDSGTAAVSTGDEAESDLDLEYSGGIAKGATIYLVYVGDNSNYSVWDSIEYAVDTDIAPIVSVSYGACETELSSSDYATLDAIMEQGASQGQSIIAATGDDGSTACYGVSGLTTTQQEALAVNYPASSAYVTGMGGTEFPAEDVEASNTTYWESASGSDLISSALSYIPEQVWNDDSSADGLSSGGGGASTLTARPSWQSGVTGIASGSYRLVPDISLDSSPNNAGYLFCSSDSTATDITGSCSDGFRDSSDEYLTVAGGTSFAAPIFAGMLAIIGQKENSTGQGLINSTLYTLAADSTTYASAFHDITSGSNECTAGSSYCSSAGESEYAATIGYDEASGLGSIDLYNLLTAWPTTSSTSLDASTTTLSAASSAPASGAGDVITITVASGSSSITTTPTGSLTIVVDGTTESSSLELSSGSATYTFSSTTSGAHVITATYSADATFAASSGAVTVTVGASTTSSSGSFTLSATSVTVSQGSSGTSTVTATSVDSFAATVDLTLSTTSTSITDYGCYDVSDVALTADATKTTTVTIYTSESACSSTSSVRSGKRHSFIKTGTKSVALQQRNPDLYKLLPVSAVAFGVFLLPGMRRRRAKIWSALSCIVLMGLLGLFTGCGGTSTSSSTSTDVATGTYTLTLDGVDAADSSITATTTFTLTVE